MLTINLLAKFKLHLPHNSFLCMDDGDGTKRGEEVDSTDDTLAYDDDK